MEFMGYSLFTVVLNVVQGCLNCWALSYSENENLKWRKTRINKRKKCGKKEWKRQKNEEINENLKKKNAGNRKIIQKNVGERKKIQKKMGQHKKKKRKEMNKKPLKIN